MLDIKYKFKIECVSFYLQRKCSMLTVSLLRLVLSNSTAVMGQVGLLLLCTTFAPLIGLVSLIIIDCDNVSDRVAVKDSFVCGLKELAERKQALCSDY